MATTCAGENPMDFSTPMRLVPATTAPLTTLATISTDITSPSTPNATMNGTHGAIELVDCSLAVRYDWALSRSPGGSEDRSEAMSAVSSACVPALAKRYSICETSGVPASRSAVSSAGVTQACAVPVIEFAMPTTVSFGLPGMPVTVTTVPTCRSRPFWLSSQTTCPGPCAQ